MFILNDATRFLIRARRSFDYATPMKGQEMPIIRTRDAVFLVGTAMGIAASSGAIQAEPGAPADARMIVAQNQQPAQTETEEEKKRRERRREEQKNQGRQGQGQGGTQGQGGGQGGNRRELQGQGQGQGQGNQGQDENRRRRTQEQGQGQGQGQGTGQGQDDNRRRRTQEPGQGQGQGAGQGQGQGQQGQDDNRRRRLQEGQGQGQGQGAGQGQGPTQGLGNQQGQGAGQGQGNQQGQDDNRRRRLQEGQGQGQGAGQGQGQGQGAGQGQGNQQGQDDNRRRRFQEGQGQGQGAGQGQDPRIGTDRDGAGDTRRSERQQRNRDRSGEDRLRDGVVSGDEQRERRRERVEFSREKLKDVTRQRKERREEGGRIVIEEPGNRRIERDRGQVIIRHDETERLRGASRDFRIEKGEGGRNRTIITRSDGIQIVTIQGENGRTLRRIKRFPDGREVILFNNEFRGERRRFRNRDRDGGGGGGGGEGGGFEFYLELPEVVVNIPQEEYYVDADEASGEEIEQALSAPPVEDVEGDYTLDEIRFNRGLRQRLRRVNLNSINFEFGAWDIRQDQVGNLQEVADAIKGILRRNPDEVFLVGGHIDSVGSDEDNLSLSDRRAETVARVLTDEFGVPPENLVTQGYGEQDLLIATTEPEIRNRRVEFMRITPLLAQKDQ